MQSSRAAEPCAIKPYSVLVIHGRSLVGHFDHMDDLIVGVGVA